MAYTLYIANKNYSSWSLRPWLLLRQLGIPFTEQLVPFDPEDAQAVFRTFSPSGKVPCLQAGEGAETITVWDSLAIVEFLAERHPEIWPADPAIRAWARSATAEMHAGFGELRRICAVKSEARDDSQPASGYAGAMPQQARPASSPPEALHA